MAEFSYKPEYDYKDTNYKPLGKAYTNDMCGSCKHYYKGLFENGLTRSEFPIQCQGHVMDQINALRIEDFESEAEFEEAKIVLDPVSWAKQEFNWDHRWYQEFVSSCTSNKKVLRGGRRCLAKGTLILTSLGKKKIEEIKIGDTVYDEKGKEIKVIQVFENGLKKTLRLTNNKKILIEATEDHLIQTFDNKLVKIKDITLGTKLSCVYRKSEEVRGRLGIEIKEGFKIEEARVIPTYDINVDSPTNLYCLANGLVTHNSGKSRVEIILVLHEMMTLTNRRILLLCPSEKLIGEFFEVIDEFIKNSVNLKNSIDRSTKNPHMIKLKNGSKLLGISISPKDPDAGDKARGFDAHLFIIDESEMFKEKDMEAIMALLVSNPETRVMVSSTPKGWRKAFYRTCTNKNLGYKEFWWLSAEKPDWSTEMESALRDEFTETAYMHEFNADFGDLEEGVFKKKYLDRALFKYETDSTGPENGGKYILGVDWNKSAGNHMVIIEVDGRHLKFVKKIVTPESEFMQTTSVQNIIDLHAMWKFKYIFVDAGYGHVSCELLKKYGVENPSTRLADIVHPIAMNVSLKIKNPVNGEDITKFTKQYIVEQTVKLLEDNCLVLPVSEDYGSSGESKHDVGLVEQMRNYKVEAYSVYNLPRYSQGADHTLTAYMLACGMWIYKEGSLRTMPYSHRILSLPTPTTTKIELSLTEVERLEDLKKHKLVSSTGKFATIRKPVNIRDLDTIMKRNNRTGNGPGAGRSSFGKNSTNRRTTF